MFELVDTFFAKSHAVLRLQKTFPEVSMEFRVSSGNPESRLSILLVLGIFKGWLGTWDAPELLALAGS